jgi:uncharacterized protein (DUF169 family)
MPRRESIIGNFMENYATQSDILKQTLGLEWSPVAVTYSDKPDERGDARRIRICEAINVVRRENVIINFSKENCSCPGGRHYSGLEILPSEAIAGVWTKAHKAYESMDIALASVRKQPQPVKRGNYLVLSPLDKVNADPDMVLLFANAEQSDRILGLVSFKGAEPFIYYPVSNACSAITNTLAKGRPEISFLAGHSRQASKWSPNELIIGLPFKDFEAAVNKISNSGFGRAQLPTPSKQ